MLFLFVTPLLIPWIGSKWYCSVMSVSKSLFPFPYLRFPHLQMYTYVFRPCIFRLQSPHFYLLSTKITLNRLHTWTRDSLMFLYVVCLFGKCHFSCRISLWINNLRELSKLIFPCAGGRNPFNWSPETVTLNGHKNYIYYSINSAFKCIRKDGRVKQLQWLSGSCR